MEVCEEDVVPIWIRCWECQCFQSEQVLCSLKGPPPTVIKIGAAGTGQASFLNIDLPVVPFATTVKTCKGPGAFADFDLWHCKSNLASQFQLARARKLFGKLAPVLHFV